MSSTFSITPGSASAAKLASSAVSDAVARARGYLMVTDPDAAADAVAAAGLDPQAHPGVVHKAATCAASGEVLIMPWYHPGTTTPSTLQMRPRTRVGGHKYHFAKGTALQLDVHPAVPKQWLTDPGVRLLVTEGLLKADSLLSALTADVTDPEELTEALEALPPGQRVVPVAMIGSSSYRAADWSRLETTGRNIYVCLDADVRTNRQVNRSARKIFQMLQDYRAVPRYVELSGATGTQGLDDWLAGGGAVADLWDALDEVPPGPASEHVPGRLYVSDDETCTFEVKVDSEGIETRKTVDDVGGHLDALEVNHVPTDDEVRAGVVVPPSGEAVPASRKRARIRACWADEDGIRHEQDVVGEVAILSAAPEAWRSLDVFLPDELSTSPCWPPRHKDWMRAVKGAPATPSPVPMDVRTVVNGWVPGTDGLPVFVLGDTVIGDNLTVRLGPERLAVPNADRFSLPDLDDWRATAARVMPQVVGAMLDGPGWVDKGVAALTLGAGLRPALPRPPVTTIFLYGAPRSGKSWTAGKIIGFWGDFHNRGLPGSGHDTGAASENAVHRMPIWAIDDLAPDVSRASSQGRESAVTGIVRAIANRSARSRMNPDMTAKESLAARALLVLTAENPLVVGSAMDRLIQVPTGPGFLNDSRALDEMFAQRDSAPRALTACLIHYLRSRAEAKGWQAMTAWVGGLFTHAEALAGEHLKACGVDAEKARRHTEMGADVIAPLLVARQMAADLGLAGHPGLATLMGDQVLPALMEVLSASVLAREAAKPGRMVMQAVASALAAGAMHVTNVAGAEPVAGKDPTGINAALGWSQDSEGRARPGGRAVGWFLPDGDGSDGMVVLRVSSAFAAAAAHDSERELIQAGQRSTTAFQAAREEGLIAMPSKQPGPTVVVRWNGTTKRGFPVKLSTLRKLQ